MFISFDLFFFFQAEDGIRDRSPSRGLGDVYKRQIYDWTNNDVWLYLLNEHVDIPEIYLFLWQAGTRKGQLRVSQFFSVDTARSLVKMNEYYPDLMERVIRREPNAYLAALYWDSEMFGRNSASRRANEAEAVSYTHLTLPTKRIV